MDQNKNTMMDQCLRSVWLRKQRKHMAAGLLAFILWFLPLFVATIIIDRYAYLPNWLRAFAALALLAVSLWQAWRSGWSQLRAFNAMQTAREVEFSEGGMDSLLVTAVQFRKSGPTPGTSAAMWELARKDAETAAESIQPQKIVSMGALKKPLRIAGVVAAVLLLIAVFNGSFLAAGLGRVFTPWLTVAYPTDTHIELGSGELVIKEGAPASIDIKLSGKVPKTAEIALQTGEGRPREIELDVNEGLSTYQIAAASRDFTYRIKAGDARSDWRQVRVIPGPRLTEVKVDLEFPEYMNRPIETVEALTLTVPENTNVNWQLRLDTPVREATLYRDGVEDLPLTIGEDGQTLTLGETALASRGYSFSWIEEEHGFDFTSPRYFLQVASDQVPRVELTSPEANLNAMLERPLELAVRARDDHGIGTTRIIHRVNRRPEKIFTLQEPVQGSGGEQVLDWDFREHLPELQIGDSVSFIVEVADNYPGENGPHKMRTEARTITFLSREEYLAGISKQMERLLSRVRTLYRQERAAHDLLLNLKPTADSFISTCQLEAIRQEMVREQLMSTASGVQALLDDLAANNVSDAVESEWLATVRDELRSIASEHVARAAELLRDQVDATVRNPDPAVGAINESARELADLVLKRGIAAAREVFARETGMLAHELARLRLQLITAQPDQAEAIAQKHDDVARWMDALLDELNRGMSYEKRPLAVLGLNRRIHDLRTSKLTDNIRGVAELTRAGKLSEAAEKQYPLIRPILEAGFTMRSGSEFAMIRELRDKLNGLISGQKELRAKCAAETDADALADGLAEAQADLLATLVLAPLPTIPAPRARLLDLELPPVPPSDELRLSAEAHMQAAVSHLKDKAKDDVIARQGATMDALVALHKILERWSIELAQESLGVSAQVSDATKRVGVLEQFEENQLGLLIQTEEAALDEINPKSLAEDQKAMAEEVEAFRSEISGGEDGPTKAVLPLLGRLRAVEAAMIQASTALREKGPEDALEPQEAAADALSEARAIAEGQLNQLTLLQQLIRFRQAVSNATAGMADVVGGQNDLIEATKQADEKELEALLAPQRNLLRCLTDIAPSLDLVAARLDVGTPLIFAASDVEDALFAMEDGDAEDAAEIQEIAVESLDKVRALVAEIAVQTGYIAEIVEFLNEAQSDAAMLSFRQRQIRENTENDDVLALQKTLTAEVQAYGDLLTKVAGQLDFNDLDEVTKAKFEGFTLSMNFQEAAGYMTEAVRLFELGEPAGEAMAAAENALNTNSDQLGVIISMLNGLPSIVLTIAEPPELHQLIDVLNVASKQRVLLRQTWGSADKALPALAARQDEITQALAEANPEELKHPLLKTAQEILDPVATMLKTSRKDDSTEAQLAADRSMRHYIIEQSLILNTAVPPASSSDSDVVTDAETDDLYESDPVSFVSDFVSGEGPKDKKSEWEILGTRNRAALNQNFARELPLEYRATLKDYYERVAE